MRKLKNIILIFCTILFILNFNVPICRADDNGYYIKSMNVDVNVNDKREYKVTETILVHFTEEKHGIIRKIPTSSSLEDYKISNINVDGAPFTKTYDSYLELKIGDKDKTIEGDKTYVVSYTLEHYDDEQSDGDYIYLNVLGNEWDTYIENFTSTIIYPKNSNLKKLTITDGEYGNTSSTLVDYQTKDNQIIISSRNTIDPNTGITLNAKLNEGTFKNAPKRVYPYTIKEDTINAEITNEKEYIINRHFVIKNNKELSLSEKYLNIWSDENNDYIKNVKISSNQVNFDSKNNYIILPSKENTYEFDISYTIEPPLPSDVTFFIINNNLGKTEKLNVNINSPYSIDGYSVDMNEFGLNTGSKRYKVSKDGNVIHLKNINNINIKEKINLTLDIDNSLFSRPTLSIHYITYGVATISFILIFLIYFRNKDFSPFISSVEFYPPNNLNPPELAYVYKERVSSKDIVSLIFYWASDNHIKIQMGEDDNFTLTKLRKLDNKHKLYEKTLFEQLFTQGNDNKVTNDDLKDAYISGIGSAISDINRFYKKEESIINNSSLKKSKFIILLAGLPIITAFIYNSIFTHTSLILNIISAMALVIFLYFISRLYLSITRKRYIHKSILNTIIWGVVFSLLWSCIYIIFIAFTGLPDLVILIIYLSSLISLILSSLLPYRNDSSKDLLGKIVGFRDFIEIAEKNRLESLLEEDPEYFYKTLPYAQVLGVTKKWIYKFKDISMSNPSYIDSSYPMNSIYIYSFMNSFNNINHTISSSSHAPSNSGGGFGGGGFSGGGSGGGGGSSW